MPGIPGSLWIQLEGSCSIRDERPSPLPGCPGPSGAPATLASQRASYHGSAFSTSPSWQHLPRGCPAQALAHSVLLMEEMTSSQGTRLGRLALLTREQSWHCQGITGVICRPEGTPASTAGLGHSGQKARAALRLLSTGPGMGLSLLKMQDCLTCAQAPQSRILGLGAGHRRSPHLAYEER